MNQNTIKILSILVFGLLWGIIEIFLGEFLFSNEVMFSSAILSLIALGILFFARKFIVFPHTGFLLGIIAAVLKTGVMGPSNHIWAIILFGLYFDLMYDIIADEVLTYLGNALAIFSIFVLITISMALLKIGLWGDDFLNKVFNYTILNGLPASFLGALLKKFK